MDLSSLRGGAGAPIAPPPPYGPGSISVSSDRHIWDYLRSDNRNLPFRFWQTGSLPCFSYVRNSEKELKLLESDSLWLARFDRKFLGYSHIWSTPLVINAILGHYARFWIFCRESFEARKQSLGARGSRLGLAGSQNSLPLSSIRLNTICCIWNQWKSTLKERASFCT